MRMFKVKWPVLILIFVTLFSGCGQGDKEPTSANESTTIVVKDVPSFDIRSANNKHVVSPSGANAQGRFVHPFEQEVFNGNVLASVEVSDPDGLQSVALSFNQSNELKYLCGQTAECPQGLFTKTESNINPSHYGVYAGPLIMSLWVMDVLGNQMLVDAVSLNWQLRRIEGLTTVRSADGNSVEINWQNLPDLLRYNIAIAAEQDITTSNYASKLEGQAKLAITQGPQTFSGLDANQVYYLMLVGIDGSGESAFSSERRLAVPSGQINTPPTVQQENYTTRQNQAFSGNVLANDLDAEGDLLTVSPVPIQSPKNGELMLNRDGSFTYTPRINYVGGDSFVYEVQDGQGGLSQGSAVFEVSDVNQPPTLLRDAFVIAIDETLNVVAPGILQNDDDINGDMITVVSTPLTSVQHGVLTLNSDGSFIYSPNSGFSGLDYFVYQAQDEEGLSASARVDIKVGDVNVPPVAVNDDYLVDEDNTLVITATSNITPLANDYDLDNDVLQLTQSLIETVKNGTLTIGLDSNFTYVPNGNFFGNDNFIYQITDGQGNFSQAIANIEVAPINDAPIALDDNYQVTTGNVLTVRAPGVLGNDIDPDGDALVIATTPEIAPSNGSVVLTEDGGFVYQPAAGFEGEDAFKYRAVDQTGQTSVAEASITVTATTITLKGASLTTIGKLTLEGIGETSVGSGIGQVRYTLGDCVQSTNTECTLSGTYSENTDSEFDPGSQGTFTMVYEYPGVGPTPTIAESISPGNNSVVFNNMGGAAFNLTLFPNTGGKIEAGFPANSQSTMSFSAFLASNATCTGLAQNQTCNVGQVGLTPSAVISGDVSSFTFAIDTPLLNTNLPPIANEDVVTLAEDTTANIDALANDIDPDGDALFIAAANASFGTVMIESDNTLTYSPNANFHGEDILTYTISDGQETATSTVTATITAVNDTPVSGTIYGLTNNSITSMFIDVVSVATDIDMDELSIINASSSAGNILIINNMLFYEPNGVAEGTQVTITYELADGNGGQATGTVSFVIGNNWPVVFPDNYITRPGTSLAVDGQPFALPLSNDTDVNPADVLSYEQFMTTGSLGDFIDSANQTSQFNYQPFSGAYGVDGSFYRINDGQGHTGEGVVSIEVSDVIWDQTSSAPAVPILDFLDLTFDGIDYVWLNNDTMVQAPIPSQGRYYAVSGRMIVSSTDKKLWQTEYATYHGNLKAIASGYTKANPGAETHIAVGNAGQVLVNQRVGDVSSKWASIPTGSNLSFNNIQFDSNRFMATANQSVAYSDNGYTWRLVPLNTPVEFRDIVFTGEQYIAIGDAGTIETSESGESWQVRPSGIIETLNAVAHGSDITVAVGEAGAIISSQDGVLWTMQPSGVQGNLNQVTWFGNEFVAVGDGSTVLVSPDGKNWTRRTNISTGNIRSVLSDGTELLLGSNNGELFNSEDTALFTPLHQVQDHMTAIASNGVNTLVRAGNPSFINLSTDQGKSWTELVSVGAVNINDLAFYNGQFIAVGDNGLILVSVDGLAWSPINSGVNDNLYGVYWHTGVSLQGTVFNLYVIVGDNGTILTSQTGQFWTREFVDPLTNEQLRSVSHDGNYFIAVGVNGQVLMRNNNQTPGRTNWNGALSNAGWGNLFDIDVTNGRAVIVGDNGRVLTGNAQTGFTATTLNPVLPLFAVRGFRNTFVIVGFDGVTFVSRDNGITWHQAVQATEFHLFDLAIQSNGDVVFAVGERGTFIKGATTN